MAEPSDSLRWFEDIGLGDVPLVGGKNASLGEMYRGLATQGILVPNGFVLTARAYRDALNAADAWPALHALLDPLDPTDIALLARHAAQARELVYAAAGTETLRRLVADAYRRLEAQYGPDVAVAVRSSATAEDLPTASFAGQHESYLNISGAEAIFEACRHCFASLFTDRAIVYRANNGFDHFKVSLSVGVMKLVHADRASSGVIFTLDTESGFRDIVLITGAYGLGENIVQGTIDPDEFYVHKPTFREGHRTVLRHVLGRKQLTMGLEPAPGGSRTQNVPTPPDRQRQFCISDTEALSLAGQALLIEDHYSRQAGHPVPMDIEWAKDADDGRLYIVQARPETVASRRGAAMLETYALTGSGPVLARGRAVGEKIGGGPVRVISTRDELASFQPGDVLVAPSTNPDWEAVMKTASAIVTDHGGRTCHAAIIARELGVPAVVGTGDATRVLHAGQRVTVSCAGGESGEIYDGEIPFTVTRTDAGSLPRPRTPIMVNLGNPELAFRTAMMPCAGVGLARMEFIISESIGIHPMALAHPERLTPDDRQRVAERTAGSSSPGDYFIRTLSEGIGTIAAAFHPRPVIVRLSDFKTNEYAALIGGTTFEPREANPMLGFRGASRYAHPAYADGFALECAALSRVRGAMGLTNLIVMVPFCRRVAEAEQVLAAMGRNGLARGKDGLAVYMMCEIPNNVIQIDSFAAEFDGFSIGSNDLTQLTLGVDRDSDIVAFDFDERDPGMLEMLRLAVTGARRNGRRIGICGEAPANDPEIARYLVAIGIDSISVNPSSLLRTMDIVRQAEDALA
ncbi:phosphoenolpyruvate synthase [Gluconacetobacter tumulicola]|uniref:Phosphoenolpyruvate synthase n=1 Tax=Gluconacetobacter tumulicola TaxID=1017177 RepID=A0A7W4P7B8_9PROT|nr:phosphoenolpyruvate synthase [Gluconacetobacter tumulicola]MBB2180236.1 phosphoenolpyruvate synthase [Gluconacetobacter tumulicola]